MNDVVNRMLENRGEPGSVTLSSAVEKGKTQIHYLETSSGPVCGDGVSRGDWKRVPPPDPRNKKLCPDCLMLAFKLRARVK